MGATTAQNINRLSWTHTQPRCSVTCYEAGDFATVASSPYASATTPFISTGDSGRPNDLFQLFVEDPQVTPNLATFTPNYVPIAASADVTALAAPVPSGATGPPSGNEDRGSGPLAAEAMEGACHA